MATPDPIRDQPFERALPNSAEAERAILGAILLDNGLISQAIEQLRPEERLNPERLISDLQRSGKPAFYLPTADAIVDQLGKTAKADEVICVFSNGGFNGIHDKLLERFRD